MNRLFSRILLSLAFIPALAACSDAGFPESEIPVTLALEFPEGVAPGDVRDPEIKVTNISAATTVKYSSPEGVRLLSGLYDISYTASVRLPNGVDATLRGVARSVNVAGSSFFVSLPLSLNLETDDFVISEIFFAGTLQRSGNQYYGDDYVKLYNNTDHVLYADGITLFETKFTTTQKFDYSPDIMNEAVTVQALYTVPGSGRDHPVQPGEYFLLADNGMDHRVVNPNSFSLTHADFEWFDVSTKPSNMDIDSPEVPNLDKWYCYTLSFWLLHNRGFKAYGIARIPLDKATYLRDFTYEYDYTIVVPAGTFPMTGSAYRLPNEWVVDVVNCSVRSEWQWNVTAPSLDMGWTHCGAIDHDKSRYFHAVRRRVLRLREDGTPVLQDTNNSTVDFNAFVTPSEIENQGTAMDVEGTPCTAITYDGVMPKKKAALR